MSEPRPRPKFSPLLVGLTIGFAFPILGMVVLRTMMPSLINPKFNVEVITRGADVSRHGGAKVVVRQEAGVVAAQTCRDLCDDLQVQTSSSDDVYAVQVLDAAGKVLVDGPRGYVSNGYGTPINRWTVAGDRALAITLSVISRQDDKTFAERPVDRVQQDDGAAAAAPSTN